MTHYLAPGVIMEPLVGRWHAWAHLIPPATLAMHRARHHVRLMRSFVAAPEVHARAANNPRLRGGPFLALAPSDAAAIDRLLTEAEAEANLLGLAGDLQALHDLLQQEGTGSSLEPLYARVPDRLRGFVELAYDASHRPLFRLLEGLLYASRHHDITRQSLRLAICGDSRPFCFSTPRLDEPSSTFLDLPFSSPLIDVLARGRREPLDREVLGPELFAQLAPYLTSTAPAAGRALPDAGGLALRYFGHACVLARSGATSVLFDPLLPTPSADPARFTVADLPARLELVIITHGHQDHLVLETLLELRHRTDTVVVPVNNPGSLHDPSLAFLLRSVGFRRVISMVPGETLELEGGTLTALPFLGEHGDLDVQSKAAFSLQLGGKHIVCAADSNNLEPRVYEEIARHLPSVDALFLGMECQGAPMSWLYGPLFFQELSRRDDGARRLNGSDSRRAIALIEAMNPRSVYVYAMAAEPWLSFLSSVAYDETSIPIVESNRLLDLCRERGIPAARLCGSQDISS